MVGAGFTRSYKLYLENMFVVIAINKYSKIRDHYILPSHKTHAIYSLTQLLKKIEGHRDSYSSLMISKVKVVVHVTTTSVNSQQLDVYPVKL